jgi:hypothetical protein
MAILILQERCLIWHCYLWKGFLPRYVLYYLLQLGCITPLYFFKVFFHVAPTLVYTDTVRIKIYGIPMYTQPPFIYFFA